MVMKESRDVTDHYVAVLDKGFEGGRTLDINFAVAASVKSFFFCKFLGVFDNVAGDVDAMLNEEMVTCGLMSSEVTSD